MGVNEENAKGRRREGKEQQKLKATQKKKRENCVLSLMGLVRHRERRKHVIARLSLLHAS
jgi:hypothetical protein